jgi:lipoyl synthase
LGNELDKSPAKPEWLRKKVNINYDNIEKVRDYLTNLNLNTVCQSANCPNIFECFSKKTATFLLMGDICTRNCSFCRVNSGVPEELNKKEPKNIAEAAKKMELKYIVLTSVTRDDLADGGAAHFARTVKEIKETIPDSRVECLIPDFKGSIENLAVLLKEKVDVLNHNIETIKKNYSIIRNKADYGRSLDILKFAKELKPGVFTKSGFMLGLGEGYKDILELLADLRKVNCDIVTIGQYLKPSQFNFPVQKYYKKEEFEEIKKIAESFNFKSVVSGIFVRSSYHAAAAIENLF